MIKNKYLFEYLNLINSKANEVDQKKILKTVKLIKSLNKKNKIIFIGNGGSAAIASHCSVDYKKVLKKQSITFNEPSLITCYANDYGHSNWMVEAFKSYANKGDILILISSSGKSENIIKCAKAAKKRNYKIITFSGFSKNNKLSKLGDINFWVNSKTYNIVENVHQIWLLMICDYINKTNLS